MAFSTGTASSPSNLLSLLKTFLEANNYVTQIYTASDQLIIKGIGGGSDSIYSGLRIFADAGANNYAFELQGLIGYNSGSLFHNQPGAVPDNYPAMALINSTMAYWFICNDRCYKIIVRVASGIYHSCYMGWMLPYGTPVQWPYPMVAAGSTFVDFVNNSSKPLVYSNSDGRTGSFWNPQNANNNKGQLCIRDAAGSWRRPIHQLANQTGTAASTKCTGVWPYVEKLRDNYNGILNMRNCLDDTTYTLNPIIPVEGGANMNLYGEFQGVKHVSGFNQSAENIIQFGGNDWLVVNDVFRNAGDSFAAFELV